MKFWQETVKPWLLCENSDGSDGVDMFRHILSTFWYGLQFFVDIARKKENLD